MPSSSLRIHSLLWKGANAEVQPSLTVEDLPGRELGSDHRKTGDFYPTTDRQRCCFL